MLVIPGNNDFFTKKPLRFMSEKYASITKGAIDINFSMYEWDAPIVGYGGTAGPEIVEQTEDEIMSFQELYAYYDALMREAGKDSILVSHVPPIASGLDIIRNKNSPLNGLHWGSQLVRELIMEFRPKLSLSGHFHENRGKARHGRTAIINPGPAYEGNYLVVSTGKRWTYQLKKSGLAEL